VLNAKENLRVLIEEREVKLTFDRLPCVKGNISQLTQVFQNLFSNAIKFNRNKPVIRVGCELKAGQWIFSIQDNGIGFDSALSSKIFEPFSRLHPADQFPGTGIGLATCKGIIERLGGKIWAESTPAVGSVFSISIPADVSSLDGTRILLVDDSKDIQELVTQLLKKSGAEVDVANNGLEALKLALEKEYDAILMDIHMPVTDGVVATEKLRAQGFKQPVFAFTEATLEEKNRYLNLGFDDYFSKSETVNLAYLLSNFFHSQAPPNF